jgi:hypothetical protein
VAIGGAILILGLVSTVRLPILGWHGLASFVLLLVLTLLSGRFTVPVTSVDGTSQTHKSVADAFIFLAVMMYTTTPGNSVGPALILAGLVGFISSYSRTERWPTVFAVGTSIISTFVATLVYRFMVLTLAGGALEGKETALVLDLLLFPLCVFGFVQFGQPGNRLTGKFDLDFDYSGRQRNLCGSLLLSHSRVWSCLPVCRGANHRPRSPALPVQ